MLNKSRYLDILLFNTASNISLEGYLIEKGWNQLYREGKEYFVKKLGSSKPYVVFPVSLGSMLLDKTFGSLDDDSL